MLATPLSNPSRDVHDVARRPTDHALQEAVLVARRMVFELDYVSVILRIQSPFAPTNFPGELNGVRRELVAHEIFADGDGLVAAAEVLELEGAAVFAFVVEAKGAGAGGGEGGAGEEGEEGWEVMHCGLI